MLAVLSGILLLLCFPRFSAIYLVWIALIPFLYAVRRAQNLSQAVRLGFIFGLTFFLPGLSWLTHVSAFGWIFMALFSSLFLMLAATAFYLGRYIENVFLKILWTAVSWSAVELMRAQIPVFGLGWNLLAYSQAGQPVVRMAANTVGAYGLGFVIVFINAALYEGVILFKKSRLRAVAVCLSAVFVSGLLIAHGIYHRAHKGDLQGNLRVALIQSNIAEEIKWVPEAKERILEMHSTLMKLAALHSPDLMVWPEASFPGYFNLDQSAARIQQQIETLHTPTIIGAPHYESAKVYYNSAYLVNEQGDIEDRYDKIYLVPFGEYVPLGPLLGWLQPIADAYGVGDFTHGKEFKVFRTKEEVPFSVMICFEDVFPYMARKFTEKGARMLVLITNDAWFGPTALPYQHLQQSVFRAIENGVPVVRAANTGVSAFISAQGEVYGRVEKDGQDTFIAAQRTDNVEIRNAMTLYRLFGYRLAYLNLAVFVIIMAFLIFRFRKDFNA